MWITQEKLPLGEHIARYVEWLTQHGAGVFDAISLSLSGVISAFTSALLWFNPLALIAVFALLAYVASAGEVDAGVYGLAAPIFDGDGKVVGSISCVRPVRERDSAQEETQGQQILALAQELSQRMGALANRAKPLG
ncbi:L-proline glycine betaine ABC transport system permease protein ProW [Pseudomonas brassicacearum]|nr:L-proline glycine betaine ABC transport system permease protein ProW [Pseudomonas brassicacearum]